MSDEKYREEFERQVEGYGHRPFERVGEYYQNSSLEREFRAYIAGRKKSVAEIEEWRKIGRLEYLK